MARLSILRHFVNVAFAAFLFLVSSVASGENLAIKHDLSNPEMRSHVFLRNMIGDTWYPKDLVVHGQEILLRLCKAIETVQPQTEDALLALSHSAGQEFDLLANEFERAGSEFETVAVETIVLDFDAIIRAYGLNTDVEKFMGPVSLW